MTKDKEITFTKERNIVTMSTNDEYSKECNLVSWNGGEAKLDIRTWRGDKPFKGIRLDVEEGKALYEGLKAFYEG